MATTKLSCLKSVKRQNGKRPKVKNNKKVVDFLVVVDRSGSVVSISSNGWAEGFVTLVKEQKQLITENLKILVTLVTFDGYATKYYDQIEVEKIPDDISEQELKNMFSPRGSTKLADTLYTNAVQQNARIAELEKKYEQENVSGVLVVWTDGHDNMSVAVTEVMVNTLITNISKNPRRTVLFTAANQDAISVGARYGVPATNCLTTPATPGGAPAMYRGISACAARAVSGGGGGFTQAERTASMPVAHGAPPQTAPIRAPFQSPFPVASAAAAPPPPPSLGGRGMSCGT